MANSSKKISKVVAIAMASAMAMSSLSAALVSVSAVEDLLFPAPDLLTLLAAIRKMQFWLTSTQTATSIPTLWLAKASI